jgi:hypothetical protein
VGNRRGRPLDDRGGLPQGLAGKRRGRGIEWPVSRKR